MTGTRFSFFGFALNFSWYLTDTSFSSWSSSVIEKLASWLFERHLKENFFCLLFASSPSFSLFSSLIVLRIGDASYCRIDRGVSCRGGWFDSGACKSVDFCSTSTDWLRLCFSLKSCSLTSSIRSNSLLAQFFLFCFSSIYQTILVTKSTTWASLELWPVRVMQVCR